MCLVSFVVFNFRHEQEQGRGVFLPLFVTRSSTFCIQAVVWCLSRILNLSWSLSGNKTLLGTKQTEAPSWLLMSTSHFFLFIHIIRILMWKSLRPSASFCTGTSSFCGWDRNCVYVPIRWDSGSSSFPNAPSHFWEKFSNEWKPWREYM